MKAARALLHSIYRPGYRYKKTGLMLGSLVPEREREFQPSLFDAPSPKDKRLDIDKIVDAINRRLGDPLSPMITRASMGTERTGTGWKMKAEHHSPHYTTSWQELPVAKA